jgi:hypothetical protein
MLKVADAVFAAYFTMIAVNYLFTSTLLLAIFGTAKIGFWQALVLNFISGVLFKSTFVNTKS